MGNMFELSPVVVLYSTLIPPQTGRDLAFPVWGSPKGIGEANVGWGWA